MLTYAAYIRPCSWSKAANLPIATTQSMLHRTYCTAAITPNLHLWSMSRLVSFGLWKVQQFAKIQDLGLKLAVSHCRHCNILSRHLCNIRFVFLSYTHPPQKKKTLILKICQALLRKAPALGLSPTQTLTHTYWMEFWVGWCQYVALPHAKCVKQASSCQRSWLLEFQLDFSDAGKQVMKHPLENMHAKASIYTVFQQITMLRLMIR